MLVPNQAVVDGFTISFNGVTPVVDGFEWSYTIVNDGSKNDLSSWVLEIQRCADLPEKLPCSLGMCELSEQSCPDSVENRETCEQVYGIKFDDLPPDTPKQTFTFVLPFVAQPVDGCFYLKYGQNRVCGIISVPQCVDDPPCPPCPKQSMRGGRKYSEKLVLPELACKIEFKKKNAQYYLCVADVELTVGECDKQTELTLCAETTSQQSIRCVLPLDYALLDGTLQVVWQLQCLLYTTCDEQPVSLTFMAVSELTVDEILYFCAGKRPDITPQDLCRWFDVQFVSLSPDGVLIYTVNFVA